MTISVNYQKRKNINLFNKLQTNKKTNLTNVQNYIPIYERLFSLNNTNWNSINLNHQWAISDIKDVKNNNSFEHIFFCKLKHISDDNDLIVNKHTFIKMAPLLDPCKYLVGKYDVKDEHLFNLPTYDKSSKVHPKLRDPHNASFVDGFFCYLSSQALNEHQFLHGLDYYGSFLAIKNDYQINVIDDIEYLVQSDFFNKNQNILFKVEDYSHLLSYEEELKRQPLKIHTSLKSHISIKSIDDSMFEQIFETNNDSPNNLTVSLEDVKENGLSLVDITDSNMFDISNQKRSETLKSGSSCSSRTSHTEELNSYCSSEGLGLEQGQEQEQEHADLDEETIYETEENSVDESFEEDSLLLTFPKFPVQLICMEKCDTTLDELIVSDSLTSDEIFSALMQIIMTLITYQKLFSFTHNDLHTNNIMCVSTNKKYIYYVFKKKTYKVPTFGRIYKIIDFGRSIYKFNGKIFCSDSFQPGGDAHTQYNTEPFYNDKKPRLEPNFSFDLCRLACSLFDYIVDDFDNVKNWKDNNLLEPLEKLIIEWCTDDNGINVLYKNSGVERYPDFKLYKMIARCVHKHTPQAQLERPEFSKFVVTNKINVKNDILINIDELPVYV